MTDSLLTIFPQIVESFTISCKIIIDSYKVVANDSLKLKSTSVIVRKAGFSYIISTSHV